MIILQEAKKVSLDQDLKTILSETPGRCIPYAVIEGLLISLKAPRRDCLL